MNIGSFDNVIGVGIGEDSISILNNLGIENLVPIKSSYNPCTKDFDTIKITGEFGHWDKAVSAEVVEGIYLQEVVSIDIKIDFISEDEDFHTRMMQVTSKEYSPLTWELYCEGKPSDYF